MGDSKMKAKVRNSAVKMRVMKTATCPDKISEVNYTKDCSLVVVIWTRNTWPVRVSAECIESTAELRVVFWHHRG